MIFDFTLPVCSALLWAALLHFQNLDLQDLAHGLPIKSSCKSMPHQPSSDAGIATGLQSHQNDERPRLVESFWPKDALWVSSVQVPTLMAAGVERLYLAISTGQGGSQRSWRAQMGNLVPCIRNALLKGYIAPPALAPRIVGAREQWLDWHHDFAANQLPAMAAEDLDLARKVEALDNRAEVVVLNPADTALQVGAPQNPHPHAVPCIRPCIQSTKSCTLHSRISSLSCL